MTVAIRKIRQKNPIDLKRNVLVEIATVINDCEHVDDSYEK